MRARPFLRRFCFVAFFASIWLLQGSGLPAASLIFPRFSFDSGTLTGIALANLSNSEATLTLTAYGEDGQLLTGAGFQNPTTLTIGANARIAALIFEVFGASLPAASVGWIEVTSPADDITGFFLFLNQQVTQFDGADLPLSHSEVVFNAVRHGDNYSTELNLVNPGNSTAEVELTLVRPNLEPIVSTIDLPARAVRRLDAGSHFGLAEIPRGSFVRASANRAIAGFEFLRTPGDLLGLNAKPVNERLTDLYFPQMVVQGPWETELGIVNYTNQATLLTIRALKPDGTLYGTDVLQENPVTRGLPGGSSAVYDVEALFGFQGSESLDGWVQVTSTSPAINGYISYGIPQLGSIASIASSAGPRRHSVFSHIATAGGFFTGLALLNPSTLVANTRILALDENGEVIGLYDTTLRPGQRISRLVNELIPAAGGRTSGMVWVSSNIPIYASSLFGSERVLANVPPQDAPDTYSPDQGLPKIVVTPQLAVLQPGRTQSFQATGTSQAVTWTVNDLPGGTSEIGTIDSSGNYTAPATPPAPTYLTIGAEVADNRGGATVDVVRKETVLSGLGILQSIVYVQSLQRLYEVELFSGSPFDLPRGRTQQGAQSELFQVPPGGGKISAGVFGESVVKLLPFVASNNREYILLLGQDSGQIRRFDPQNQTGQVVFTGLQSPTTMAFESDGGNLLVAESNRIVTVARSSLQAGLAATSAAAPSDASAQTSTIDIPGATGLAVDACTGVIYFSLADEGTVSAFDPQNGEIEVIAQGLSSPGNILAIYRVGLPCPWATQLLVAEPGADRIALIDPGQGVIVAWIDAPGVKDIVLLPANNPYNGLFSIAYGNFFDQEGEITIVPVDDQYGDPPTPNPQGSCIDPVQFEDPNLAAAVRQALGLGSGEPILCRALQGLTELSATGRKIQSLEGLQHATGLVSLDVSRNYLRDLTPITELVSLVHLDASYNLLETIGLLGNLVNLTTLNLSHNLLEDVSDLHDPRVVTTASARAGDRSTRRQSFLPSLEHLNLGYNSLTSLNGIGSLVGLKVVNVERNPGLSSLESLQFLTLLEQLIAGHCAVTSIEELQNLLNLAVIRLPYNRISVLDPLLNNPGIGSGDVIDLTGNPIPDSACAIILQLRSRGVNLNSDLSCGGDLGVTISSSAEIALPDQLLLFRVDVTNLGDATAEDVILTTQLPSGTAFSSVIPSDSCSLQGQSVVCNWDELAPGATQRVDIRARVQVSTGTLVAEAEVSSSLPDQNPDNDSDSISIPLARVDLAVTKNGSRDTVIPGDTLTYSIVVSNSGPNTATQVQVTDTLPSALIYEGHEISSGSCSISGQQFSCQISSIATGASVTIVLETLVSSVTSSFSNQVSVTSRESDLNTSNNTAVETTDITQADLAVTKVADRDVVYIEDEINYTVTVTNNGPQPATGVILIDTPPEGVFIETFSGPNCTQEPDSPDPTITCSIGTLAPGANAVLTINAFVSSVETDLVNTATVSGNEVDPNEANNTATATSQPATADLALTKVGTPNPVTNGEILTYTLEITNNGPHTATNIQLVDEIPPGTFLSSFDPAANCDGGDIGLICNFASLAAGAVQVVTVQVSVGEQLSGTIDNTATVFSFELDPNSENNAAFESVAIAEADLLIVSAVDNPDPVVTGTNVVFTTTVRNDGPDAATNVVISHFFPSSLDFSAPDSSVGCEVVFSDIELGTLVSCPVGPLGVGEETARNITALVNTTNTSFDTSANVTAAQIDPNPDNNSANVVTSTIQVADLEISKIASVDLVSSETGSFEYTITAVNHGPSPATGILIVDQLSQNVTFEGASAGCDVGDLGDVLCTTPFIAAGQSAQFTILVDYFNEPVGTTVENLVTISGNESDPVTENNTLVHVIPIAQADLSVTLVDLEDPVVFPGPVLLRATVTNNGPHTAVNVFVSFSAVADATYYTDGTTEQGTCSFENFPFGSCSLGNLAPGASVVIDVIGEAQVEAQGVINNVTVFVSGIDPDESNNSDSESTFISP